MKGAVQSSDSIDTEDCWRIGLKSPTYIEMASSTRKDTRADADETRATRRLRRVLVFVLAFAALHVLVATPHFVARLVRGSPIETFTGVESFARISDDLWRGGAPSVDGYQELASAGVVAIVDLRAEADPMTSFNRAAGAGIEWTHIPIRDGQTPTAAQLAEITKVISGSPGPVFIHCQAGVGRTGSVVAALQVARGHSTGGQLVEALRFGPLSLEQQVFILRADPNQSAIASLPVVAASRVIDSPRRLWSRLTG